MSPPKHYLPVTGAAKALAEKSRFTQTCHRLSLFLKEKGSIRDLSFEINAKYAPKGGVSENSPATLDLLSNIDDHAEKASQGDEKEENINNLPEYVILDSSCEIEDATKTPITSGCNKPIITKPKSAQMTIFYGGQILVLDDVPADRARELMLVAKNGRPIENPIELAASPSGGAEDEPININAAAAAEVQAKDSDLPIARRASLHKFLAKRKDRATVRSAPYQVHNQSPGGGSSSGNDHSFDLNL